MKPLVFASYAQFGVDAEERVLDNLQWHVNLAPIFVETYSCDKSIRGITDDLLRNRIKPVLWRKLCAA